VQSVRTAWYTYGGYALVVAQTVDVGTRIGLIADELRALAGNGLFFTKDPYDKERFERIQVLAAALYAIVDTRDEDEIARILHEDLSAQTPIVAVDGAVFDADGRLLLAKRADSGLWCIPGGASDVGESPSAGAEREVREETGLVVRATRLLMACDNRSMGLPSVARHAYYLVFECELLGGELTPSIETTEFRWVTPDEAASLELFRSHIYKVPEVFRLHADPGAAAAFH
jgi:ADP-ribose pyrophosphatase YjhB (NUDIX family)